MRASLLARSQAFNSPDSWRAHLVAWLASWLGRFAGSASSLASREKASEAMMAGDHPRLAERHLEPSNPPSQPALPKASSLPS